MHAFGFIQGDMTLVLAVLRMSLLGTEECLTDKELLELFHAFML